MSARNRRGEPDDTTHLPDLQQGITLCSTDATVDSAIHALAVDHVLLSGGEAVWIDPGTHAQTGPLAELAPSDRILDRIRVARGFTAFQHLEALRSLPGLVTRETSLVVVPQLDRYYRADSLLADEGTEMLLSGIASLATVAREQDVAVLVTRARDDEFSAPIETAADHTLTCESTPFGPRFRADDEETLVYPVDGGRWVQTTLSFWTDILAAREPLYESSQAQPNTIQGVSIRGSN